jgi:UV DNA damage endonuclease
MLLEHIGYCCINQTLRNSKPANIFCGRSLTKKYFTIREASNRALSNCRDLLTILKWNEQHNIRCFRISSDLFPRFTCSDFKYSFTDLPHHKEIQATLKLCGDYAFQHKHIISFHPGPFTTLASPTQKALDSGIREFLYHDFLCDLIDPDNKLQIDINIHIGGSYGGDFINTSKRFIDTFNSLPKSAQNRMCVENDDKSSMWSIQRLYSLIHQHTGIPICFDAHHWLFCHDTDTMQHDFNLAQSTWSRPMQVHYSQSKFPNKLVPAHSDYYTEPIPSFITDSDNIYIHLEAKQKELALFDYLSKFHKELKAA